MASVAKKSPPADDEGPVPAYRALLMSSLVSVCRPDSGQSFLSSAPKIRHCAWLEIQAGALYKYYCVHSGVAIPLLIHTFGPWKWGV
jgi:hypothetical protein